MVLLLIVVHEESGDAHRCAVVLLRYLESCSVPITMKRKCLSSSNTTSSNSDDCKQKGSRQVSAGTLLPLHSCLSSRHLATQFRDELSCRS